MCMSLADVIWSEGDPPTTPTSGRNGYVTGGSRPEGPLYTTPLFIHATYADGQDLEEKVAGQTSQGCQGKRQEGEGGCKKPPQQETPRPTPGVSSQRLHLLMEAAANLVTKVVHNQITGARDNTTSR